VIEHYIAPKDQLNTDQQIRGQQITDQQITVWNQLDQRVLARAMLARTLWLQGHVDQAGEQARASLAEAQVTDYQMSVCEALRLAVCPVAIMTGDLAAAERSVALLVDLATSRNATFWRIVGRCLEGKLLIMRGEFRAGVGTLRAEIDACQRIGWAIWYPEFLGVLAEGVAGLGRLTEALVTIDEALARADRGGECYYAAELLRIKGELLLQTSGEQSNPPAEDCFRDAVRVARQHGALSLELRIALSLARWRMRQDRPDDARDVLAPVYGRFTEGFATADLRAARTMLDALAQHGTQVGH
jgi:predicted ATPase